MSRIVQHFACASLALALLAGSAFAAGNEIRMRVEKSAVAPAVGELSSNQAPKAEANATATPSNADEKKKPEAKKSEAQKAATPKSDPKKNAPKKDTAAQAPANKTEKSAKTETAKPSSDAATAHAPEANRAEPAKKKPTAKKKSTAETADTAHATSAPAQQGNPTLAATPPVKPVPKPEPKPAPAPQPMPKPKPAPVVDPKAFIMPQGPSNTVAPITLPADASKGQLVGNVTVEFQPDRVILHAATNAPASQITHFNLTGPRKLAIDLRGAWHKMGGTVLRYDTGPVKVVVAGEHPDRLRLALEFRDGAVTGDVVPTIESSPTGLTVTVPLAQQQRATAPKP